MESILTSIKKLLGIDEQYTHFDADLTMHINSVFMVLNQIGVGPKNGFFIFDSSSTWNEFFADQTMLQLAKSYVYLKVKLLFDPPTSSAHMTSITNMIAEFEWRLNVAAETMTTTTDEPIVPDEPDTPQINTVAILGNALLGSMKLGYAGG